MGPDPFFREWWIRLENYRENLSCCNLCPRRCGVDRLGGKHGFCGASGDGIDAVRASLHMWEEPCISGTTGSGTIFFSHCTLKCIYCQNHEISGSDKRGFSISAERLSEIMLALQKKGAQNINLVTPTHYVYQILDAIRLAKTQTEKGILSIPVVYNTGGYELPETIGLLEGSVQIFLTDFKYWDRRISQAYSSAENYRAYAIKSLDRMLDVAGSPTFDTTGKMTGGVIVRHLALPGLLEDSMRILAFLYKRYGERIYFSIMNQYTPPSGIKLPAALQNPLSEADYEKLISFAEDLGISQCFIQYGGTVDESFVPAFDGEGIL